MPPKRKSTAPMPPTKKATIEKTATAMSPSIDKDLVAVIKKRYNDIDDEQFIARIDSLVQANQLTEAGRIARDWTLICPEAHHAHVHAGAVYMLQGKSNLAVEALEKALALAPEQANELKPKLEEALSKRDKKVDGVGLLPQDAVDSVIAELNIEDYLICKAVSKEWRQRLTKSKAALHTAMIVEGDYRLEFDQNLARIDQCCDAVVFQSDGIRELYIGPEIRSNTVRSLVANLRTGFENLETLGITVDEFDVEALEASVKKGLKSLNKLLLTYEYGTYKQMEATELFVPTWRCLAKFSNLTHFSFHQFTGVGEGFPQRKLPAFQSLTHLSLKADWLQLEEMFSGRGRGSKVLAQLKTVCKACPNLLFLSTDIPLKDVSTIRSLLPKLQCLKVNVPNYNMMAEDIRAEKYLPSDITGLRKFQLYVEEKRPNVGHIFAIMNDNKGTLKELMLQDPTDDDEDGFDEEESDEEMDDEDDHWSSLAEFKSDHLEKLCLSIKDIGTETIVPLIKNCPNLTNVIIENNTTVTDALFDALLGLPKLEHVKLLNNDNLSANGLKSFFTQLKTRNTLKYLHLQDMDRCLKKATLDALADVTSLTTLVLSGKKIDANDLTTVAEKLINLDDLFLHLIKGKLYPVSIKLSQLPKLTKLECLGVRGIQDSDIITLASGSHSLTKVKISGGGPFTPEAIKYANKYIVVKQGEVW